MKKQKLNNTRYNTFESDWDPMFDKKLANREARTTGKKDTAKQLKELGSEGR